MTFHVETHLPILVYRSTI